MGKNKKGFSLIELIIVLLIIGILLFISAPLFVPEKLKFDQYANSFTNLLYRSKMAAIFNLYNTAIIYDRNTGIFTAFVDTNSNRTLDSNEEIIQTFPTTLDFLRRSNTRLSGISVFNGAVWIQTLFITQKTHIITFDRKGFAQATNNTQIIDIYITNQNIKNKYRYEYCVRITNGGDIRLIKRNI